VIQFWGADAASTLVEVALGAYARSGSAFRLVAELAGQGLGIFALQVWFVLQMRPCLALSGLCQLF